MVRRFFDYAVIILALLSLYSEVKLTTAVISEVKFAVPERLRKNNETAFDFLTALKTKYDSVDLGLGIPDFKPPASLITAVKDAVSGDYTLSQYTSSNGHPRLVQALARFYSPLLNITLDPLDNVNVHIGATQALFAIVQTHTNPGDEWIIIEPYYTSYVPIIRAAYGVPRSVLLRSNEKNGGATSKDWTFDRQEMAGAFNSKTKGILINNPHNPTGKVFSREELEFIADLAKKWDVLVVSDEVYEFMIYGDTEHIRIASLPGMFERTITLGSASKTFSATGYRLGWSYGGTQVMNNLKFIQEQNIDSCPTFIQEGLAHVFEKELVNYGKSHSYLSRFNKQSREKRDYLIKVIRNLGMSVIVPNSGYFMVANLTSFNNAVDYRKETGDTEDVRFVKWLIKNVRLEAFPLTGYYSSEHKHAGEKGVRFCFMRNESTLKEAARRVNIYKSQSTCPLDSKKQSSICSQS